jgi:hypothetical protein
MSATTEPSFRWQRSAPSASVLAIGYRLAPEHPWPASVDDTVAALRWVASAPAELGEAPGAVAVAGDSAGEASTIRRFCIANGAVARTRHLGHAASDSKIRPGTHPMAQSEPRPSP